MDMEMDIESAPLVEGHGQKASEHRGLSYRKVIAILVTLGLATTMAILAFPHSTISGSNSKDVIMMNTLQAPTWVSDSACDEVKGPYSMAHETYCGPVKRNANGIFWDTTEHPDMPGKLWWDNGDRYSGGWKDGKFNGHGTMIFLSGRKLVGEFKDGKIFGHGTMTYPDGLKYVGEFADGKENGQGTMTWANGDKYVGEVKDGKLTGHGILTYFNGDKAVGEFKDGKLTGHGTMTFADLGPSSTRLEDNRKYTGEWKNGLQNGQGTMIFPNGATYVGEWKDGVENGQGTFTWPHGSKDVGEFKNGRFLG